MSTAFSSESDTQDEIRLLRARVAELECEQEMSRAVSQNLHVMISVVQGPDFVYEFVNPAYQALAPGKTFLGRRFADVWGEGSEPLVEALRNVVNTGQTFYLDDAPHSIQREPGAPPAIVRVSCSCIRLPGRDGKPHRVLTLAEEAPSVRPRSAHQHSEAQRQLLETLTTHLPTGVALIRGSDLRIIAINKAFQENAPGQEMMGRTLEEVWPEHQRMLNDTCLQVLTTGEAHHTIDEPFVVRRAPNSEFEVAYWTWSLFRVALPHEEGWGLMSVTIETTNHKRAEKARRESEAAFETLANLVPQMVWMCTPDGSNVYFNKRWVAYTGLTLEESYGSGWNTPFHPDDKQLAWEAWNCATQRGGEYRIESRLRAADGSYRWFLIAAEPLKDAAGRVVRWFGTCTDIEPLKQSEEALRQSEQRFRALVMAGSNVICRLSADASQMIHVDGGGFVADSESPTRAWVSKYVHPDDQAHVLETFHAGPRSGAILEMEHRIIRIDGSVGWVSSRAVPLRSKGGEIIEWFGVATDITARKMAEGALKRQAALLDLAHDAIIVRDEHDKITFWNRGAEATYGWRGPEAMGRLPHELLKTTFPMPLEQIKSDLAERGQWQGELTHICKDGKEITVISRWALQRDAFGNAAGIMEINRDITGRKVAERHLQENRDRLALAQSVANAGSFDFNLITKVVEWSEEVQQLYGIGPGQSHIHTDVWAQWLHPEDRERVLADLEDGIRSGEVKTQFRIYRRDTGELRWIEGRARVQYDLNGTPQRLIGFDIDITEHKRAEEALRESSSRERARAAELEAVMDAMPGAIFFAKDAECSAIYGNRRSYDLLRRRPGSNLSKTAPDGDAPTEFRVMQDGKESPFHELPVQKAARTGHPSVDAELDLVYEDGSIITIAGGAEPLLNEEGRSHGAVGVFVDITPRKQAEQALRDSEERMRLAQETVGIGHFDWNLVTGETVWSESLTRMIGPPPAVNRGLFDKLQRVHPDDQVAFREQLERAISGLSPKISISYRSATPEGTPCWRICEARIHADKTGKPARLLGVIADITPHKQAEQARQLEQERKHLEAGFRAFVDGVLLVDAGGELISINPAAARMCGFDDSQTAPKNFGDFAALFEFADLDGRELSPDRWPFGKALRGQTTYGLEGRCRNRKTGHTWTASFSCAPVLDASGAVIMVVLGIHDTSGERAVTEELQRANTALQILSGQLLRSQDEERKRIARELHDGTLQTLTAISMKLLLIARSPGVMAERETQTLIIEAQDLAKRCSRELRTVSYLLHPPELDELGLVAALRSWADGLAHRAGLELGVHLDDPGRLSPEVETALFRIAQESLSNVQRHSGTRRAELRLEAGEDALRLEVIDEGGGIPPAVLSRPPKGLGVGILGMRERVRQLGGTIEILTGESGTTVRAILPRRR